MSKSHQYAGIMTSVPTPFDSEGRFSASELRKLIERLIKAEADAIVPVGGTGEYISLTFRERLDVVESTLEAVGGRCPVIPGVISAGFNDAVENARAYVAAGAKAIMVVTPYYYRPTQEGVLDYYKRLSDKIDADIILYEIPYRTGVSLHFDTVNRLAEMTRVVGIKACNPDLAQQMRVAEHSASKMAILSGEEDVLPLHVAMGAVGGIISSSNLIPRQWKRVLTLAMNGQLSEAIALHATFRPLIDALFAEPNPAPLKTALGLTGLDFGGVLPPLFSTSEALRQRIAQVLPALLENE
ncbi:4-hydroxy-tetrahydrodipicolinate synthase [Trinickia acidisoli]|uniref:4-hydroxy-tetrahydrodipicolinate synthase n=1 Tax=Trinickia acidisoli TaxID=2767482 RepID=UPI001A8CC221|nr:4-hydroxy-tetrahydrodipicolinate synthase [Trinickia acidisoli]